MLVVKNPTVSVGDIRDTDLTPGLEVVQSKIFHFVVGNEIFKVLCFFFGHIPWFVGSQFPDQGLNLGPLAVKVQSPNH